MAVAPLEHPAPESRAMLLERAVELTSLAAQVERERFIAVAAYADAHTTGALMSDLYGTYSVPDEAAYDRAESAWVDRFGMVGADRMLDLAGAGAPEVSEFAVVELAEPLRARHDLTTSRSSGPAASRHGWEEYAGRDRTGPRGRRPAAG